MKKRQLNEQEIEISQKSIERLNEKNKIFNYYIDLLNIELKKLELDMNGGWLIKLNLRMEEVEKELKSYKNEIKQNEETIQTLKNHIEEGIKPKYTG